MSGNANSRIALRLVGVVLLMGVLAWVAVPFYSWFCKTTGFGGTPNVAEAESDVILDELITIRFDANVERGMPWKFKPVVNEMTLRIGETGLAFFEATNPTDRVIAGAASYNVSPDQAGYYFDKIQCFCFTEQVLQPHETVQMPVSFFVDPELVKDKEAGYIRNITLSYTFHETELPGEQAALTPATPAPYN
jgi:cytochrome c oxidase assembly protein subunit 11